MAEPSNTIVPPFDFGRALLLPVEERFAVCIERAKMLIAANGYQSFSDFPCVPGGASEAELDVLTRRVRTPLPEEYAGFLRVCRYLKIDDGCEVGGLDYNGLYVTEVPWLSRKHRSGVEYLVFASYWRYADGDQLMFDLSDATFPVVAYLHEHGPLFEAYAPSFSLALWRLVHEENGDGA